MPEESTKPRVLAVDDEEHITVLVAMGLGFHGFDVERVASGRAALVALDRLRPDLLVNARKVLTRDQILANVWDSTFAANASLLETYISYLRHKVDAVEPPLIHTIRGVGYSLRLPPK